jgi:hypothetical protein
MNQEVAAAARFTLLASREAFLEAVFLWRTPLEAAFASTECASRRDSWAPSPDCTEERSFFTALRRLVRVMRLRAVRPTF